eukprot:4290732-Heterocapsa_arctica.AAC.1
MIDEADRDGDGEGARGSHISSGCVSRDPVPGLPPRRIISVCGSRPHAWPAALQDHRRVWVATRCLR